MSERIPTTQSQGNEEYLAQHPNAIVDIDEARYVAGQVKGLEEAYVRSKESVLSAGTDPDSRYENGYGDSPASIAREALKNTIEFRRRADFEADKASKEYKRLFK